MEKKEIQLPEGFTAKVSFRSSNGIWTNQKSNVINGLKALKPISKTESGVILSKDGVKALLERLNTEAKAKKETPHAMNIFAAFARAGLAKENPEGTQVFVAIDYLK